MIFIFYSYVYSSASAEDRDGDYAPPNDSTGSLDDSHNNSNGSVEASTARGGARKRSAGSPNSTMSKRRAKDTSPPQQDRTTVADSAAALHPEDEARMLKVLNEGTLVQILDLWGIGAKKASLIMSRRTTVPLNSVRVYLLLLLFHTLSMRLVLSLFLLKIRY